MNFVDAFERGLHTEPLPEAPEHFQSPKVKALWDWWRAANGGRTPPRSAFDILDCPALIPNLFLIHAVDGTFEFRIYGEDVIRLLGTNARGRRLQLDASALDGTEPAELHRHLHQYYSAVLTSGHPWRSQGTLPHEKRTHIRFEALDVPLSRDWPKPDTILGIIDQV